MSRTMRVAYICIAFVAFGPASRAAAYDLSSFDEQVRVENGFVYGRAGIWFPAFGTFDELHQTSLDFGGQFGIRFARIRGGEHNLFAVAGFDISPQLFAEHYHTLLWMPSFGVRYEGLCIADGLGCPFFELRFGFAVESTARGSRRDGPTGDFTVLPGIGYRFKFGPLLLAARADIAFSGEDDERSLSWLTLSGQVGFGW
jgi:hypothetical protein